MLETEYIKSMNLNFERIKLDKKPEEKRYQYCIASRGGIRGLLDCSMRFINSDAFLYYNITSKQNLTQLMHKKKIDREWLKDLAWNLNHIQQEMRRFLLDDSNVIWYPEQVYKDLDENTWSFIYYPYYEGENGFNRFLDFVIEKLDYDDERLVECAYRIYEQYEEHGDAYLKGKIFDDIRRLDKLKPLSKTGEEDHEDKTAENLLDDTDADFEIEKEEIISSVTEDKKKEKKEKEKKEKTEKTKLNEASDDKQSSKPGKKGLFAFLEGARKKDRETREKIRQENMYAVKYGEPALVAEEEKAYGEDEFDSEPEPEEYGKTVYMESVAEAREEQHRLYSESGAVLCILRDTSVVIGKKKGEADVVIDNSTVSRLHARIIKEKDDYLIEDLNSTNGTFKNGLRMRPYERRRLATGDEVKLGSVKISFK